MPMLSEQVMEMTSQSGRISLMAGQPQGGIFETSPMQDQLFAVLTFPVTGMEGNINVRFSMVPESNGLVDTMMMMHAAMSTDGGAVIGSPSSRIPTLSEWGIIAFIVGLFLSGLLLLRRRPITR